MIKETWKQIEGYNGRYEVSNLGRVKSYAQDSKNGKILKCSLDHKGYPVVGLRNKCEKLKTTKVHRLVASAFIENPNNLPQVNHKDENKLNNDVNNLEWCDNYYNICYGTGRERAALANRCCQTTSKKVFSIDPDGNIEAFNSIGEAERQTGNSHCNIVRALKHRRPRCGNRTWHYY